MSSLWTPGGEHRVPRADPAEPAEPATAEPAASASSTGSPAGRPEGQDAEAPDDYGREQAAAELARMEEELLAVPAADVVANHCFGLFQLAALHLGRQPPNVEQARLAIDALGVLVEGLGDRLGEAAPTLREGLAQIRLAFVQIAGAPGATAAGGSPG